jgi:hypothetical protein
MALRLPRRWASRQPDLSTMTRQDEVDDPRRRLLVQALAAGWFGGIATGTARADIFGSSPATLPPGQSVYRLSGGVRVNGTPATMKTFIGPSDTVETDRNGEIVFAVGTSAFLLRSGGKMVLQGEKQADSLVTTGLRLLTGKLLSVFGKAPAGLRLQTITATVGIRGTGVYLESDPELTYFCTCYGTTDVASLADPTSKESVTATHHDKPLYITGDAKQKGKNVRAAPFKNHTDQELMLIETLVGRTVPFVFPGQQYDTPRRDY